MRSLVFVAVVAALTSACGVQTVEGGTVSTTAAALSAVDGIGDQDPGRIVLIDVDTSDPANPSCTVDGMKFGNCTLTTNTDVDVFGNFIQTCSLLIGAGDAPLSEFECNNDANGTTVEERRAIRFTHCP